MELPEDLKLKLKELLPAAAVSPHPLKPGLSAIKVIYVVERLNDVFGLNGWHVDNEIVETGQMIVVRATLSIPKYAIAIEQFGGNDNPDRGDAYKGACTDALSKCASYLGIGMDVYKGLNDTRPQASARRQNTSHAAFAGTAQQTANRTAGRNADLRGLTTRNDCPLQRYAECIGRGCLRRDSWAARIPGRHHYPEHRQRASGVQNTAGRFPDSIRGSTADDRAA